jgi:hypothetical protein
MFTILADSTLGKRTHAIEQLALRGQHFRLVIPTTGLPLESLSSVALPCARQWQVYPKRRLAAASDSVQIYFDKKLPHRWLALSSIY